MFCKNCGAEMNDNAVVCVKCGAGVSATAPKPNVPNHLVGAILVTIFCCQIFGIVSIVYAALVNGKLAAGDVQGAIESSNKAKTWMWLGFGLGLPIVIITFLFQVANIAAGW